MVDRQSEQLSDERGRSAQDALGSAVYRGADLRSCDYAQRVNGKLVRDPFPGNIIPQNRISAVSQNLVENPAGAVLPQVKGRRLDSSRSSTMRSSRLSNQAGFNQTQFSTKSDYNITSKQRLQRLVRVRGSSAHAARSGRRLGFQRSERRSAFSRAPAMGVVALRSPRRKTGRCRPR